MEIAFKTNQGENNLFRQVSNLKLEDRTLTINPPTNAKSMNDNIETKIFDWNKPASLIAELLFLLTYHSSPLVFSVYHEFLLSVESFLFLLALGGHLLHLLCQLSAIHKSKLTTMMQKKMKKRNLKRKPVNSRNNRAIFAWPWKMVLVSVRCSFYQPMEEKIKTWPLRFPAKENPNMEKALFDWPIVLQYEQSEVSVDF